MLIKILTLFYIQIVEVDYDTISTNLYSSLVGGIVKRWVMTSCITRVGIAAVVFTMVSYIENASTGIINNCCRCLCAEPARRPDSVEVSNHLHLICISQGSNGTPFGSI